MTDREAMQKAFEIIGVLKPDNFVHRELQGEAWDALRQALAQPEFDTPESHIVKWSIPVDPNNFGEPLAQPEQESKPIYVMGNYAGEGKVVSASFGLPKGAFEFAPHTGKGEASKIKHSLEPQPEQEELIQFKDGKWSYVRKPWVGLTDDEKESVYKHADAENHQLSKVVSAVEWLLKNKNTT